MNQDGFARITLRIPQGLHDTAKARADAEHVSLNSFIVRATEAAVGRQAKVQPQGSDREKVKPQQLGPC